VRIGLVEVSQETDTFNPLPTTMADFASFGLYEGREIVEHGRGDGTVGGYLSVVEPRDDVETVGITRGLGVAGGRIDAESLAYFEERVRHGLATAGRLDGLAMHLHGACAADGLDDVEGRLLSIARDVVGPAVPIVLTLDHHANITQQMVDHCDALVGFRTQPHDPFETGEASTQLLLAILDGRARPAMAWRKIPLLSHQEQYLTSGGPMKAWFDRARALEREPGVLSVSLFPMQPWLDVDEAGWAAVVVTNDDRARAERLADDLADLCWSMRDEFQVKTSIAPHEAVRRAEAADAGIVILSDQGDSVFGGSAGDSTVLLESMLRQRITKRALIPLIDADAVGRLAAAGVGATVTTTIGGTATPFFRPLEVTGTVRNVGQKTLRFDDAPFGEFDMGPTVVLDVGPITLLISTYRGLAGNHPGVYRAFGVEPRDYHVAVVKTASNFQYFRPISTEVIRVDTPGPTQSDILGLPWRRVPRPIYPLDEMSDRRR